HKLVEKRLEKRSESRPSGGWSGSSSVRPRLRTFSFKIPAVEDQHRGGQRGCDIKDRVDGVPHDHSPRRGFAVGGLIDVIEIGQIRQQVIKRATYRSRERRTRRFGEELQIRTPAADQEDQQREQRRQRGRREAREQQSHGRDDRQFQKDQPDRGPYIKRLRGPASRVKERERNRRGHHRAVDQQRQAQPEIFPQDELRAANRL